jgi:hypothetical protein
VRERLRQIIAQISGRSTTVHRGRGKKLFEEISAPLWERFADQGGIRYAINNSHPLVERLRTRLDEDGGRHLDLLVEAVSASLPVEMVYSDYSTHPREVGQSAIEADRTVERLIALRAAIGGPATDAALFREVVRSTRLFERQMEIVEKFIREEFK